MALIGGAAAFLGRRVRQLEDEKAISQRLAGFTDQAPAAERRYRFIASQEGQFAVRTLCRVCQVSASAYYAWRRRGEGPTGATVAEAYLANEIFDIWVSSRRRYGSPRVTAALRAAGRVVSEKTVAALMAALGIAGLSGRRKLRTTVRDPSQPPAPDLVRRKFSATRANQLLVGDITYLPTDEGYLYLASVLDVFSRRLIGYSIADHMRAELCTDALRMAAHTRAKARFTDTIFHSDHGAQYTSAEFKKACTLLGITQSMGTVGDSYDNAMAESLWSSLKRELVDASHFQTKEQARLAVFEWIVWYNRLRLHSSLEYQSPEQFEKSQQRKEAA